MGKKQEPKPQRKFSIKFKKAIVREYTSGKYSVLDLCKLYKLHAPNVYNWIYKYGNVIKLPTQIVEMKTSTTERLKNYERRISELEQVLGKKQLLLDYYIRLVDQASEHYGEDIKKTSISSDRDNKV